MPDNQMKDGKKNKTSQYGMCVFLFVHFAIQARMKHLACFAEMNTQKQTVYKQKTTW